jgi:hypothetical protein
MSIYYVMVGKNEYQVEISDTLAKINGESVQAVLDVLKETGLYLLHGGAWKRELHVQAQGNSQYILDANGRHAVARVEKSTAGLHRKPATANTGDLAAPMPRTCLRRRPGRSRAGTGRAGIDEDANGNACPLRREGGAGACPTENPGGQGGCAGQDRSAVNILPSVLKTILISAGNQMVR